MNNTEQLLVEMYHPLFRDGYQAGRLHKFEGQVTLTDLQLVENLYSIFQGEDAPKVDESVYYAIGHLVGQMSGAVLARQPHEDNTPALQEAFLLQVRQAHGGTAQALIETIRHFWVVQDQLAQTLEADFFVQMMRRGIEPKSL